MTGFISTLSVLVLFAINLKNFTLCKMYLERSEWKIFKSPLDVYMASLLLSDILQGLGKIMHVKWLHLGFSECSSYCTAQGVVQQIGETGVALATLAIAVHTFLIIFFRRGGRAKAASVAIVATIWIFVILFAVIGSQTLTDGDDRYITPSPYGCWLSPRHKTIQLTGEYLWLWLAALVSLILYVPLALRLAGYVQPTGRMWWEYRVPRNRRLYGDELPPKPSRDAFTMLLYPISYFFLVLPNSICRWMGFTGHPIPSAATFFSTSLFGLSGLINVLLLWYTRPGLLLLTCPPLPIPGSTKSQSGHFTSTVSDRTDDLRLRPSVPILIFREPEPEA
ncbi:hypothetical protein M422DRAFT_24943 [Sphaerobolus stellatus SS14]|nr:hypothetical protein M422DRAFT_24943 [Sphaerobolus stellatus SS14]